MKFALWREQKGNRVLESYWFEQEWVVLKPMLCPKKCINTLLKLGMSASYLRKISRAKGQSNGKLTVSTDAKLIAFQMQQWPSRPRKFVSVRTEEHEKVEV